MSVYEEGKKILLGKIREKIGPDAKVIDVSEIPCNRCGDCCRGEAIGLTLMDLHKLAKFKGMSPKEFFGKYGTYLVTITNGQEYPQFALDAQVQCPFLSEDNSCTVYEARPLICQLHPASCNAANLRGDCFYITKEKFPRCGVREIGMNTYVLHDVTLAAELTMGIFCSMDYFKQIGNKQSFEPRYVDNFYRKEMMMRRNSKKLGDFSGMGIKDIIECLDAVLDCDARGEAVFDAIRREKEEMERKGSNIAYRIE